MRSIHSPGNLSSFVFLGRPGAFGGVPEFGEEA